MARLTKADAARQLGIARSTLYKLIGQGKLSPTPDGLIDQAALVRAAAYVDTLKERTRTSADIIETPHKGRLSHLADVRRQMTANSERWRFASVRRRRQTSSWTSDAN